MGKAPWTFAEAEHEIRSVAIMLQSLIDQTKSMRRLSVNSGSLVCLKVFVGGKVSNWERGLPGQTSLCGLSKAQSFCVNSGSLVCLKAFVEGWSQDEKESSLVRPVKMASQKSQSFCVGFKWQQRLKFTMPTSVLSLGTGLSVHLCLWVLIRSMAGGAGSGSGEKWLCICSVLSVVLQYKWEAPKAEKTRNCPINPAFMWGVGTFPMSLEFSTTFWEVLLQCLPGSPHVFVAT